MCGIAGVMGRPDAHRQVLRMTAALAHRGPDGAGVFCAGPEAALGHARLAVVDLSEAGAQPMTSRDGRWTIVLNGEIFNYRELRRELGMMPWRSATDTEVLLEACAAWGIERALHGAVGMFAFALWDAHERELTLVRDRMGEKPLVYFEDGHTLAFASELKALRNFHDGRLDASAVEVYLALGYVPAPLGIFRNVRKLSAGHRLRWKHGRSTVERWWFPERSYAQVERTPAGRIEQARSRVADAVRLRLQADVPVALALSGGVDSSVVAAEAVSQGARLDAFTVVAEGDETDLPYASSMARRHGLPHEVVRIPATAPTERLLGAVGRYDEPFADSSALCSLDLARALGGRYKVILNGDGGDEAFAGYRTYTRIALKQAIKAAAAGVGIVDGHGRTSVYVQSCAVFRERERLSLLNGNGNAPGGALPRLLSADEYLRAWPGGSALQRALWTDRHLSLANGLTHKMDMALGAYGVEGRAPFLDHRILEWTQGLPARELVRGQERKILLREAYRAELPRDIVTRSKHGFGAPIGAWLAGPLRGLVEESLPCPLLHSTLQKSARGQRLWALLMFARWAERWGARW
ncbi:MAG TPA: asparagine synthase (glutamine-hydrolyzing) [Bryobacteraceae bacterium]|nr:asparagine synthase (glutamine-hydrolyzing) [Bryobacteraceae bacterium]